LSFEGREAAGSGSQPRECELPCCCLAPRLDITFGKPGAVDNTGSPIRPLPAVPPVQENHNKPGLAYGFVPNYYVEQYDSYETYYAAVIVRAVYDYEARQHDDLSFKKGDRMELVGDRDAMNLDWWVARHVVSKAQGYIPSNYVVVDDNNPESQEWWFVVDRREADKQLQAPGHPIGTFMIRPSADKKSYALSIRDYDDKQKDVFIKHYRIRKMDNGGVYISPRRTFNNIIELVEHYKQTPDGLCCRLTKPCPKEPEPIPFKDIEVERNAIRLIQKLGGGQFGDVYKGKWRNQVDVAVKTLKPGQMTAEAFLEEAKIMHRLRHRKLVQLMGVCSKEEPVYIITELMVNGAMLDYLRKDVRTRAEVLNLKKSSTWLLRLPMVWRI